MNGNKLEVTFHGRAAGTLSEAADHRIAFAYAPEWLREGFPISPFSLPLKPEVFVPSFRHFGGLFGVFADSLPDAWGQLLETGTIPPRGFGALLDAYSASTDNPLAGAGSMVILPREVPLDDVEVITLPAGEYACMYKYFMPYDVTPLRKLLAWIEGRGLVPAGLVVDRCLLDSVFYNESRKADFCRLEVLLG